MGEENKQVAAWAELGLRKGGLEEETQTFQNQLQHPHVFLNFAYE